MSHATTHAGSLSSIKVGMLSFLVTEAAFFGTLLMAYVTFLRSTKEGSPSPQEVFHLPLVLASSLCLFSSSTTVHFAEKALHAGARGRFMLLWATTICLGVLFLLGTAKEWTELIGEHGLTISRNMFGTTYFTLVGFHAAHVTIGLLTMLVFLGLALRGHITERNATGVVVVSWYWHFVDAVWVVVFTLVYLVGR